LKEKLLGRSRTILLHSTVFEMDTSSNSLSAALALKEPQFTGTNGLQVWVIADSELSALRRRLEQTPGNLVIFSPRVMDSDLIHASISATMSVPVNGRLRSIGLTGDFLPRINRDSTDLSTMITQTIART